MPACMCCAIFLQFPGWWVSGTLCQQRFESKSLLDLSEDEPPGTQS